MVLLGFRVVGASSRAFHSKFSFMFPDLSPVPSHLCGCVGVRWSRFKESFCFGQNSPKLFGQTLGHFVRGRPTDPQVPMLSTTISMVRDRGTQDPGLPLWSRTKPRRGNRVD